MRLALEDAGADYLNRPPETNYSAFAPPYLKAGKRVIGQTANILLWLGPRLGLAPKGEAARLLLHQQQLTITDWLVEVHDTHHPIAGSLYYEEQKKEARRRARIFREVRLPKFMAYFEANIGSFSYVHLSLFQMVEGLRYAFPRTMSRIEKKYPELNKIHKNVTLRPRIAAYLASARRIAFNQDDIFRHYPELDRP